MNESKSNVHTKELFLEVLQETGDQASEVTCCYLPTAIAGMEVTMETRTVDQLPAGNLYPCFAYSSTHIYNQILTKDERTYKIQANRKPELSR